MTHELNPAQRDAVTTLSGPLLVLAGAGTGKTRVVTHRIARLIHSGIRPSRILAVTFTNKAAEEMQERTGQLLGKRRKETPHISTFHSLCVRILRRHIQRLGYPAQFAIYDRGDQESVARAVLREIRVPGEMMRPSDLLSMISRWKAASVRPTEAESLAETDKQHLAAMAYGRYQRALKVRGAVDFDDLLLCTEELFQRFTTVRRQEAQRFDHLLIDEYQDTNTSQYKLVRWLAVGHRNLCVVGDDDQSIYGWRGADLTHILRFRHDWPGAKIVRLEENYRSTQAILVLANRLIAQNRNRHAKTLHAVRSGGQKPKILQLQDETEEAKAIIADIKQQLGGSAHEPRDFAILFRTNEQPRPFEMELRREKLPYVLIGGMSFYDRKEVRDILAYLKILISPTDEISLLRIINTPARGIGQKTVELLMQRAIQQGRPLWDVMTQESPIPGLSAAVAEAIRKFQSMIRRFGRRAENEPIFSVVSDLVSQIRYRQELERIYKNPEELQSRSQAVEEVVNALASYAERTKKPTLQGFLDDVSLGDRDHDLDRESKLQRNAIALLTLHSAKGLEFPQVYIVGMEEGLLPHYRSVKGDEIAIEEERRLCYVGITRAEKRLTFSLALSRRKWGKSRPTEASRFLFEITGQADNLAKSAQRSDGKISGRRAKNRSLVPQGKKNTTSKKTLKSSPKKAIKKPAATSKAKKKKNKATKTRRRG